MQTNTAQLIQAILDTKDNYEASSLREGTFQISEEQLVDPVEVLARIRAFEGEGWLCTAESQEVHMLPVNLPSSGYPLHAEVAKGNQSLHLRQDGQGGWILTTLSEDNSNDTGDLLYDTKLLARGETPDLRYTIQCTHQGLSLQPYTARFTRFETND